MFEGVPQPATPHNRRPSETEGRTAPAPRPGDDDDHVAAMIEGDAALYSGRFEDARVAYLEALELRPDAMAPVLGALRAMVLGGHAEARADLAARVRRRVEEHLGHHDTRGAGHLLAARLALALGETGEALDEARLAVQFMPDLGVAWRVLGEASMAAELWPEAVEALHIAVDLGLQAEAGTWERLADALDEVGHTEGAIRAAREALAQTGADPHAQRRRLNLLGVVLKHAGELEAAGEAFEEARALGPDDPAVLHNIAALAEELNRADEALELYFRATEETPVPTTLWRKGKLLLTVDRPNDALRAFTRAAANLARWSWPESTRWWPAYEVGKLYARANHHRLAIGWFEDALREARDAEAAREITSWLAYVRVMVTDETAGASDR